MRLEFPELFIRLFDTDWRYFVGWGGRNGLKSWSTAQALLIRGRKSPIRVLCAREIQNSIGESVHYLLKAQIAALGFDNFYTVTDTEIRGRNGTQFIFAGLRTNISKVKSYEDVDIVWIEEAANISKNSYDVLLPTIRKPGSQIIITFNPELDSDETYQRFIVNTPKDCIVVKSTYKDNKWMSAEQYALMEDCKSKDPLAYDNIWLGNCRQTVEGAIFAKELSKAEEEGRIGNFPYDSRYPVSTFWDLGWADNTSIWFLQIINHEFRIIDCYQSQFEKTAHYVEILQRKGYRYDRICLPHDSSNEHANADRTWLQIVKGSFPNASVYAGKRQRVEMRLEASKNMFPLLRFDKNGTTDGRNALAHYHFAIDPITQRATREPFHGPESNYADAFGYLCLECREPIVQAPKRSQANLPFWAKR